MDDIYHGPYDVNETPDPRQNRLQLEPILPASIVAMEFPPDLYYSRSPTLLCLMVFWGTVCFVLLHATPPLFLCLMVFLGTVCSFLFHVTPPLFF